MDYHEVQKLVDAAVAQQIIAVQGKLETEILLALTVNKIWNGLDEEGKQAFENRILDAMVESFKISGPHRLVDEIINDFSRDMKGTLDKRLKALMTIMMEEDESFQEKLKSSAKSKVNEMIRKMDRGY